jgi:putative serine protease PepD
MPLLPHDIGPVPDETGRADRRRGGRVALVVTCVVLSVVGGTGAAYVYDQLGSSRAGSPTVGAVAGAGPGADATEFAAGQIVPSVVQVIAGRASGSGFVIDGQGRVMTNHHVIEGQPAVTLRLSTGREVPARVVGSDPAADIAVLEIRGPAPAPAPLGVGVPLRTGASVLAVGSPLGLSGTVTAGIVSAVDRQQTTVGAGGMIQTDASINPGNSGGPLVNLDGQVVGVNTAIATYGGRESGNIGIGFSVPIDRAMAVADRILSGG